MTLQLPTLVQVTPHAPMHVTLQVPTLVQSAVPPGPSVIAQLPVFSHV
jgi:hypothetical protein